MTAKAETPMAGVVVVGSFNVDHVWTLDALPLAGETRSGRYGSGPGGKGFNQAVAAARSGASTRFVCALGEDAGGLLARALAVADGIDMRDARSTLPTGSAGIFVDAGGSNSIVAAAGANGDLTAEHVAHELATGDPPAVVLVQLETPVVAARTALESGRATGACTILNPAPANVDAPRELLDLVNVLTPNETEFAALLERGLSQSAPADRIVSMDDDALHGLCRKLLPHSTVVVTLGAAGCFVSHPDDRRRGDGRTCYRVAAATVRPVDTTGAGDAFSGALAASIAGNAAASFARHVRFAAAFASMSTEQAGAALAMPRRDEVLQRFPPLEAGAA